MCVCVCLSVRFCVYHVCGLVRSNLCVHVCVEGLCARDIRSALRFSCELGGL